MPQSLTCSVTAVPQRWRCHRHCLNNSLAQAARVVPSAVQPRRQGRQIGWCHAPRPARHQEFLVDAKGVWPENGQFGSPAAPLRMVWKKICVVSCSFPVPRHVRGGMVDSFSDRLLMLISLLCNCQIRSKCCHFANVTSQLQLLSSWQFSLTQWSAEHFQF